ncbi:L-threonylcarbamoyladenylate synthase [cf. Phormidesmis sp. LEGE 11477]|uniref:L-threonylcarbamoyladenylate synthase n=1 Tax=cf. Phormidesmis sp. LEGE 11477 TaxID=1828680 RepID=UPI00187E42A6|nr:L-threonylcarbamoyladenylate synthase [cf. Phormidesmis sp. LEGE 11477]MBE9061749.1 threonylcarbamoyl-AMP synthase [cf. Phormidesmis sp. LEGE 11477]
MATLYEVHPVTPDLRTINALRDDLRQGAIMLYPTDTVYAIGCDLGSKSAIKKVRQLKQLSNDKPLTFLCASLSNVASYAHVTDPAYKIMKRLVPGPYTFLLPATKAVPKLVINPKRRTTGIRVPNSPLCLSLIEALDNPVISTSAISVVSDSAEADLESLSKVELFDRMEKLVDVVVDSEAELRHQVSTIVDVTDGFPQITRQGQGWQKAIEWGAELAD